MKELESLYKGLVSSRLMLMKQVGNALECSFLKEGIVHQIVLVKDEVLNSALRNLADTGILEGEAFVILRNNFSGFVLQVKAQKLYLQLRFSLKTEEAARNEVIAA